MNGKELRSAMWKQVKGRRGYLLLGLLITLLPIMVQNMIVSLLGITIPVFLGSPFGIFSNLLTIGLCKIAMDQVGDGKKSLGEMFFFLKDGLLGKALVLSIVLWVVNTAFTVLPALLEQYGTSLLASSTVIEVLDTGARKLNVLDPGLYMQGNLLTGGGGLLKLACLFISKVLIFPIQYRFALHPEESVMDQLAEGINLAWKNFWGVFGYRFLVGMPFMFLELALAGSTVFLPQYALLVIAAYIAFFCLYMPYAILAEAALAKRLFVMEEKGGKLQEAGQRRKGV